jgi:hypothetical protein
VVIAASAPVDGGGLVHALTVLQPVQTWTVIRGQDDFLAVAASLATVVPGLPPCPDVAVDGSDVHSIVMARNALQQWLTSILMYPAARESPSVHTFLVYAANMIPPQYEHVPWTMFNVAGQVTSPAPPGGDGCSHPASDDRHSQPPSPQRDDFDQQHAPSASTPPGDDFDGNFDDMMMDDMFEGEDEDGNLPPPWDSEDEVEYRASVRYRATDEPITKEDEMEIANIIAGEVEMIEDVGSNPQSWSASCLSRSLRLQDETTDQRQAETTVQLKQEQPDHHVQPQGGVKLGNAVSGASSGGIGGAMERALPGQGGSVKPTIPESPPILDAFKMVKVIGKGSFGKE